ncbi:GAF domain-containing protein [Planomonospora sp. ID67723]|uniref:sensor histidine kinase n=1 Tax=Planomonospora sp. ID67723 TaxID=2738134 RepID=UPI0018C3DC57|nr:ATP-binding protein [Planomonospora sp. ID67723]MBG0833160.1 GAF domain-containing protein [Planomonospora sp. ID67723]
MPPERQQMFLHTLLDSLASGVVACDADGYVVVFNQPMRQSRPHIPGLHIRDIAAAFHLYAADGRTPLKPQQVPLARALAGEHINAEQVTVHPPGRRPHRFAVTGRPIDAPDGQRLGAMVVLDDITETHRAGVLADAQHAVAHVLADATSAEQAAVAVVAAVTEALGWSCGEYWQVTPDQAAIARIGSWTAPGRDLSAFLASRPDIMHPGQGVAGTTWAGGHELWISDLADDPRAIISKQQALQAGLRAAIGLPVRSGRQVLGVLTFFTDTVQPAEDDLTRLLDGICAHVSRYMERRRAEELAAALATSRRHFEQVITQINDNVWTAEVAPDGSMHSVYQSQNAAPLLGRPLPEDADLAEVLARRVHPDDRTAYAAFTAALGRGERADIECRIRGLDDVIRWIWIRATPRRDDGRLFIDGISTDVTERHRLAEQREQLLVQQQQQVRRLREMDRMKDELMALVTHELRNPIGAIRGYAEMLADDADLTSGQQTFVDVIDRKSAQLQRLVDDLLDLARLDTGQLSIDLRPVDLARLTRQALEDHRPAAQVKQLTLTAGLPARLPIHADPLRLRQVLDNLLSNAIKYTPDQGAVTVTATAAAVGNASQDSGQDEDQCAMAVLAVADTGIGIPPEQYEHLFSRFFRASTAKDAGIKGTGLGLAIVRSIVTAHGGTITAAPREGGGTVFTVALPVER